MKEEKQLNVKLWPNPVNQNGELNFESDFSGELLLTIYDHVGRKVYSEKVVNSLSINPKLSKGIYMWVAYSANGIANQGKIQVK